MQLPDTQTSSRTTQSGLKQRYVQRMLEERRGGNDEVHHPGKSEDTADLWVMAVELGFEGWV